MIFTTPSRLSWYYVALIAVVLVLGAASSVYTYLRVSESTKQALIKNVASVASVFEPSSILALRGDESDLDNPAYTSIKNRFEKIQKLNADIRFVYLLGYRDGDPFFFVDSEPATSPDYSPPGQVYGEATAVDRAILLKQLPSAVEISSDRWGTWLSALTPILDEQTGAVIAVMGMDVSANTYYRTLYVDTAIPILITLFILTLILIDLLLRRREQEFITFKSEMVSIASHEIRSPLTGISWMTKTLLHDGAGLSQKQKDDVTIIQEKSEELLITINDLLDLAVVEKATKKSLAHEPVLMKALFEKIQSTFSLTLAEKRVTLHIDSSITPTLAVVGDADKLNRMFNNLISNAIKYSHDGGVVSVGVVEKEGQLVFSVHDEGIGISKSDQAKIFSGFFRAENAKQVTKNGTGLGLHYVKQIAELHGGTVSCESAEGQGATFSVALPKV